MWLDRNSSLTTLRLCYSLCLLPDLDNFRNTLEKLLDKPTSSTTDNEREKAVLEVLQMERDKKLMGEQDENTVDEASQPQVQVDKVDKVDSALKVLVRNATEEFGFVPRDVYEGVLDLPSVRELHAKALENFDYSALVALVGTFSKKRELQGVSHRVVAVRPVQSPSRDDRWAIDFKSARIMKNVVELMQFEEKKHLHEMYALFHKTSESSALAGWIFEVIVHRVLSDDLQSGGPALQPIRMVRDNCDPPNFSIDPSNPPAPDTSLPSPPPLCVRAKAVTLVNFIHNLSNVTLDNGRYYIPTTANNPLFDSFTIDHDIDRNTTVIFVFQITTSSAHRESARGYLRIRKIVARVRDLLESRNLNTTVEVAYFLVCPNDGSKRRWEMPVGWNDAVTNDDHRGDVFCIHVPVLVHLSILRQSTPENEAKAGVEKRTAKRTAKKGKVNHYYFKSTT